MEYCGGCREDEAKPLVGISAFISCFDAVDPVTGRQNLNTFISVGNLTMSLKQKTSG